MPLSTANLLSKKELALLQKQRDQVRHKQLQDGLEGLKKQAQFFFQQHLEQLRTINQLNNEVNLARQASFKSKLFHELSVVN